MPEEMTGQQVHFRNITFMHQVVYDICEVNGKMHGWVELAEFGGWPVIPHDEHTNCWVEDREYPNW